MFGRITNQHGELLDYAYHPGMETHRHIAIVGHGVTGNKDRPWAIALCDGLSSAGIHALRFSFSGNGQSEGRFVDSNISKEVEDLGSVIDACAGWTVGYVGHSMGGAVGVARASMDPRLRFLVSLAGMVHTKAFAEREFGSVKPDQGCMWDEPSCPLSSSYMRDLTQIDSMLDRAGSIRVPWLLVHGADDDVVPLQDSRDIFSKADRTLTQLWEVPACNHVFSEPNTQPMVNFVCTWMRKILPS